MVVKRYSSNIISSRSTFNNASQFPLLCMTLLTILCRQKFPIYFFIQHNQPIRKKNRPADARIVSISNFLGEKALRKRLPFWLQYVCTFNPCLPQKFIFGKFINELSRVLVCWDESKSCSLWKSGQTLLWLQHIFSIRAVVELMDGVSKVNGWIEQKWTWHFEAA